MTKEEIENEIRNADRLYYATGNSPYSDRQYDNLKAALADMDPDNPLLNSLGQDHVDGFRKVKHARRMLSLEKFHELDLEDSSDAANEEYKRFHELFTWMCHLPGMDLSGYNITMSENYDVMYSIIQNEHLPFYVAVEPKVDGMSAEALYIDGRLKCISTRGDGDEGDDITANVKHLFPEKIAIEGTPFSKKFVVRGELYISVGEFQRINKLQEEQGFELFANPRNLCAGTVKCHEGLMGREISFVAHDYISLVDNPDEKLTATDYLSRLQRAGIDNISNYGYPARNGMMNIFDSIAAIDQRRDDLPFVIDGAVVKIMDYAERAKLGETEHHPRWAVAFKYLPERKETTINSITWQVGGKTGKCVPVAEIEPVIIDGTVVSRVSLGNAGLMAHRGICQSSKILIEKSGEIIPYVRKVIDPQIVVLPDMMRCPSCGAEMPLTRGKTAHTANYFCPNEHCKEKIKSALCSAFGRDGLNVLGFGTEAAEAFIDDNPEWTVGGFSVQRRILELVWQERVQYPESLSGKAGDNLFSELQKAQTAPLHRWLSGMQIEGMASGSAKKIAQKYPDLKSVIAADDAPELVSCLTKKAAFPNMKKAIEDIVDFIDTYNIDNFNPQSEHYIDTEWSDTSSKLGGKNFVVTGRFRTGRTVIENMVIANGGQLKTSVSKKTDYLVAGQDVGATKTNKAAACGTKVITEEEFLAMVQ